MISLRSIFAILAITMFSITSSEAQGDYATLIKNINYRAAGLNHDLSATKDTLKLSSDKIIQRVYTVGEQGRAIDLWVNRKQRDIALTELYNGTYVFVVEQDYLKIIFQVVVNQGKPLPLEDELDTRTAGVTSDVKEESEEDDNSIIDEKKLTKEIKKSSVITSEMPSYKSYNLSDIKRDGMQSRAEARKARDKARESKEDNDEPEEPEQ